MPWFFIFKLRKRQTPYIKTNAIIALGQFELYGMPIERCSDQKSQSLREFYNDLKKEKSNPVWEKKGQAMLDFLDMIDENFKETRIWGMTSHDTLVLQAQDGWGVRLVCRSQ